MTAQTKPREKCDGPGDGSRINAIIAACNRHDRFKLLEDDSVLPGDLDNPVHPAFHSLDNDDTMKQMLRLASQFLMHDTLLVFFIPLLFGRQLTGTVDGASKTYLSDPIANASEAQRDEYIFGVREALHCLGHSLQIQYAPPIKRVYARTLRSDRRPSHIATCSLAFQRKYSCSIELADFFGNYYHTEYAAASRCSQFRHDFLFATTLVHEIVHAVGVLRRGDLNEPHIRTDCPETEWGYGWEHFMFGNVFNPQDRTKTGTHLLMRKVWADQKIADSAGGKEYSDVPMSYIAQWFRQETWKTIAKNGPMVIPPPITHFKIQSSNNLGAWVVSSDQPEIQQNLSILHNCWKQKADSRKSSSPSVSVQSTTGKVKSDRIFWRARTTEQLLKPNVPIPLRIPKRLQHCLACGQIRPGKKHGINSPAQHEVCSESIQDLVEIGRCASPCKFSKKCASRKRQSDDHDENSRVRKMMKR